MTSFFPFREALAIKWDGVLPPGAPNITDPEKALMYLTHIAPFAKYSKKMNAYIMALSAQNLRRIHAQFGNIRVSSNYYLIDALKKKNEELKEILKKVDFVKNTDPAGFPKIEYKVKPLGIYQERGVHFLLANPKAPLFADCGVGKSYMILMACQERLRKGLVDPGKILICVKLATLFSGWKADVEKFTDLKAQLLWLPQTKNRKEKIRELINTPADLYVINHDGVKLFEQELSEKNFQFVVIDESTILKSFRGARSQKGGAFGKAAMNVARRATYRAIMSGTPAPNGIEDLWGQFKFLDPEGLMLEASISDFRKTYMKEVFFGDPGNDNTPSTWVPKKDSVEKVHAIIKPMSYIVKIRDCITDLPPRTNHVRSVLMTAEQERHYEELAHEFLTYIEGQAIEVRISVSLILKFRQITGGFLYDHDNNPHVIAGENPKMVEMDCLLREQIPAEEKVVIFAQYDWEIRTLAERYKDLGVVTVYGGNSSSTNLKNINDFINNPAPKLIILHPKSAAHGITLTVACYMIFYSFSYSAEDDYQAVKRIERAVQKRAMVVYYLSAMQSVDEIMYEVVRKKQINQDVVISGTRVDDDQDIVTSFTAHLREKYPKKRKRKVNKEELK